MFKPEHVRLADYSHLFTEQLISLALASLKDPELQRPSFMLKFPGVFRRGKHGLEYVNTDGVSRTIVPQEKRDALLKTLWSLRDVPRGQESFFNYVNGRFIGVQSSLIRDFVGRKMGIQMVRTLSNPAKGKRAVRGKVPFSHISCDLADMISFSDVRGKENERFVFLLCDDFSGYLFAKLLPLGKDGYGVAKVYKNILKKRKKLDGKPRILTSDLGGEFWNQSFQQVNKDFGIKHLKPKTGARIAPYIENRVRHFKKYTRLLSKLLFEDTYWYEPEIIRDAAKAVNNIQRESGFSAKEIVQKWRKKDDLGEIVASYHKGEKQEDTRVGVSALEPGDFVRIRVAKQKIGLDHKTHLGFKGDDLKIPVNWSVAVHRVIKTQNMRVRRTVRYLLDNKLWYDRSQLLKIPATTEKLVRMPRSIPEKEALPGRRSSRLREKKRTEYKE